MANKTQPTTDDVDAFLASLPPERRPEDARRVHDLMREITGEEPVLWGKDLVGFGRYAYTYASGRAGEWFRVGFSPRKASLTLYIMPGFSRYEELMGRLGKHKTGKSCLYIKRLSDVDEEVLRELIALSIEHVGT